MRLSRLVWSPYETAVDQAAERALLGQRVSVQTDGADAEILVTTSNLRINATVLDARPAARLLITTTSGTDHIDLPHAASRGVTVARLPMARRDAVVEVALGLMLDGLHRLGPLRAAAAQGVWARAQLPALGGRNLSGQRVGVVGMGVIGRRFAQVVGLMGAEVWACDPVGVPQQLGDVSIRAAMPDQIFARCAAVSLHCSLTPTSRGLVDADLLALAQGLVLVNTARGKLIDVHAAMSALDRGRLSYLGLDVFPQEPWPQLTDVVTRPDLVLLPHASGYHRDLSPMVRTGLVQAVDAFVAGNAVPHRVETS